MLGRAIALAGMLVAFRREIPLGSKELAVARNRKTIHPSVTTPQNAILHSGKRDYAPELIRGSQGSGRDRPAFEGPNKRETARPSMREVATKDSCGADATARRLRDQSKRQVPTNNLAKRHRPPECVKAFRQGRLPARVNTR